MTSNHGFAPIPEVQALRDKEFTGGRLVWGRRALVDFVARLNRAITTELCLDPRSRPVIDATGWGLVYSRREFAIGPPCGEGCILTGPELDDAVARALRRLNAEELTSVLFTSQAGSWPAHDSIVAFARNSLDPERSPDAFLELKPGGIVAGDPGRGSSHGGFHDYNLHVPLVLWGAGVVPGAVDGASTPYDLAPTLAGCVGIKLPEATGRDLLLAAPIPR